MREMERAYGNQENSYQETAAMDYGEPYREVGKPISRGPVPGLERDKEYWDGVAYHCFDRERKLIKENFHKKRTIIGELLQFDLEDLDILEIGCGSGIIGSLLIGMYGCDFHYTATDISDGFRKLARMVQGRMPIDASITNLPFEDKSFSCIFLFDVLEHIHPDQREKGYSEMDRVLTEKPGVIFINTPVNRSLHEPEFDHGFNHQDLAKLLDTLKMDITYLRGYVSKKNYSQFMVLGR